MKNYRNNWDAEKMIVNFNQKQWRQDLASFIASKLNWIDTRVSRSKFQDESTKIKIFEIFDGLNNKCVIKFTNKNEILLSSYPAITEEYLSKKGV